MLIRVIPTARTEAPAHPSGPADSLETSEKSSSSDDPALDDSSSLSARQYVRGLCLKA